MRILLIDNYDSFTYNLLHLFAQIPDVDVEVVRNDQVSLSAIGQGTYDGVIISPGPGDPTDPEYFGKCALVISDFGMKGLPILGVCLGFQGIAASYGAKLKQAKLPQHGKTSKLKIVNAGKLLQGVPDGIEVMRYHSLMIDTDAGMPEELIITAEVTPKSETVKANGREIMAIQHKSLPIFGVQFHPESFATEMGNIVAKNFVNIARAYSESSNPADIRPDSAKNRPELINVPKGTFPKPKQFLTRNQTKSQEKEDSE